eukprot:scaffold301_cov243-Pinguiococcus_pyrenoidosus.AAC.163
MVALQRISLLCSDRANRSVVWKPRRLKNSSFPPILTSRKPRGVLARPSFRGHGIARRAPRDRELPWHRVCPHLGHVRRTAAHHRGGGEARRTPVRTTPAQERSLPLSGLTCSVMILAIRWGADFSADYVQDLSAKTGNFKTFEVFVKMLYAGLQGDSDSVFVDLLTYQDLELLKVFLHG